MAVVEAGSTATAVVGVVEAGTSAATEHGLELPAGGGEEWITLGQKLCPPQVFTMVGLDKERRRRGNFKREMKM